MTCGRYTATVVLSLVVSGTAPPPTKTLDRTSFLFTPPKDVPLHRLPVTLRVSVSLPPLTDSQTDSGFFTPDILGGSTQCRSVSPTVPLTRTVLGTKTLDRRGGPSPVSTFLYHKGPLGSVGHDGEPGGTFRNSSASFIPRGRSKGNTLGGRTRRGGSSSGPSERFYGDRTWFVGVSPRPRSQGVLPTRMGCGPGLLSTGGVVRGRDTGWSFLSLDPRIPNQGEAGCMYRLF